MQYHFVVMYDDETNEFQMDYDTQEAKFNGAPLFDTTTNQWVTLTEEHFGKDETTYNRAADLLYSLVEYLPLKEEE